MDSEYNQIKQSPYIARSWLSGMSKDADYELSEKSSLADLRMISSRLIKQNFHAALLQQAYVNTIMPGEIVVNCIGRPEIDKLLKVRLGKIDLDETQSLTAMIAMIVGNTFQFGDVAVTAPVDAKGKGYIACVEAHRIKTPNDMRTDPTMRDGVKYRGNQMHSFFYRSLAVNVMTAKSFKDERKDYQEQPFFSKNGKRLAYLFRSPINLRPDQTRQVPMLAPLMNLLRYVDSLLEYTLIGHMVASAFSVFIRSKNPDGTRDSLNKQNKTGLDQIGQISPGSIWFLNGASESIEFASPNRPSDNTDLLLRRLNKYMAAYLRIPYDDTFLDTSDTSYAAFKSGQLVSSRMKKRWDDALYPLVHWIVMRQLDEMYAKGEININPKKLDLDIVLPKLGIVDEEKASRANRLDITETGVKSRRLACTAAGDDFDAIQDQLDQEAIIDIERKAKVAVRRKELEEQYGITIIDENSPVTGSTDDEDGDFDSSSEKNKQQRRDDGNW